MDRAMAAPEVVGAVAAVVLLVVVMVAVPVVRGLRRRKRDPEPVVVWIPDERPQEVRFRSYADEKLDELRALGIQLKLDNVGSHLRAEVDRKIAERPEPDYAAALAAIDDWARKRGLP